ncbi:MULTISPECIES: SIS domain-containing protein [unclassified Curtobacterium]|uniref:D-sedoheptulose-7-phosphate isomerase n=1 Tax=unclassified Curtobacterium TaxID=257496 RepID=UPI000DA963A9|nr:MULTISPECIES: SIS domain-containing protein [unclassified Curtobacterium]PZE27279.1 phosphoheptose isomerase [Curtobacterium sp. MCBD17_028]PZE76149.1 phosphoheptose isomerase [Curtobacterium sp. MCBD17_019]PZF60205.1 phosphoheptose isomerase [Curtobacterium sp. MCBD17_034]PZM34890.1 phosphoheptose isomerase [Curtobacterium sp. MCBD17_031]WIB63358.1 SIS domain-containing protein [Curtobacterium sp. MCBD17_040]
MTIDLPATTARPTSDEPASSASLVLDHIAASVPVIASLAEHGDHIAAWADDLASRLGRGQRLLAAGNGGSAAEAQHLTSELVGRFDGDRPAFSAISLHAESSAVTAIGNDYGYEHVFARQVHAHARAGDVLVLLSTSGKSENLLNAARAARSIGVRTWAMTGSRPNPLAEVVDDAICIDGPSANVQEAQLVLVHALCRAMEPALKGLRGGRR